MPRVTTEWDTLTTVLSMVDADDDDGDVSGPVGWFGVYHISTTEEASSVWTNIRFNLDEETRAVFQSITHHRLVGHWVLRINEQGFKTLEQYDTADEAHARFTELESAHYGIEESEEVNTSA